MGNGIQNVNRVWRAMMARDAQVQDGRLEGKLNILAVMERPMFGLYVPVQRYLAVHQRSIVVYQRLANFAGGEFVFGDFSDRRDLGC